MNRYSNFAQRAFASIAAIAMTATMVVSYYAVPQAQTVSGMLA